MAKKRQKHVPQRSCVSCREKFDKRQLTRLVRTAEAGVGIDPTGKRAGRGAYLCDRPACWEKALQNNLLERALRTRLSAEARETLASKRPPPGDENEDNV